jgi:hypothetical protein
MTFVPRQEKNNLEVESAPPTLPATGKTFPTGFTGHSTGYKRENKASRDKW